MKEKTRNKWLDILNRFVNSEMSFEEFAHRESLNSGTLRQYYYMLRNDLRDPRNGGHGSMKRETAAPVFDSPDDIQNPMVQYFLTRFKQQLSILQSLFDAANFDDLQLPTVAMFGKALVGNDDLQIPRLKYLLKPVVTSLEEGYLGHKEPKRAAQEALEWWKQVSDKLTV